jgi:type VI secretion system protein VasJ
LKPLFKKPIRSVYQVDATFDALGTLPIPGENPAGTDAKYEPEYGAVLTEIEKLSFSGQGAVVSWPTVEEQTAVILKNKSKDLQIAAYLGVALWHNRGLDGMLAGVRVLAGLLREFWQTAYPPVTRMRGRVNALDWWHERSSAFLHEPATRDASLDADLQKKLLEALADLDGLVGTLLPAAMPLHDLISAVRGLPVGSSGPAPDSEQSEPEPPSPPDPPAEPAATPPADAPSSPSHASQAEPARQAPAPIAADADDPAVLRRRFVEAGQAYLAGARRDNPADPTPWRLLRLILWGGILAVPQAEDNRTQLPTPDMTSITAERRALHAGNALEMAFAAEEVFAVAPFCLDAQFVAYKALTLLGERYAKAAEAIEDESARFTARLPGVEKLRFADGAPFAEPETVTWLRNAALSRAQKPGGGVPASTVAKEEDARWAEARELMAQNKLADALNLFDAAKTDSPSANLRLRVRQLRILCDAGESAAAMALAEALMLETTRKDLDNWDPQLALSALIAVRGALNLFDAQNTHRLCDVNARIARIKPSATLG